MGWKLSWGALLLLFGCEGLAFGGGEEWVLRRRGGRDFTWGPVSFEAKVPI